MKYAISFPTLCLLLGATIMLMVVFLPSFALPSMIFIIIAMMVLLNICFRSYRLIIFLATLVLLNSLGRIGVLERMAQHIPTIKDTYVIKVEQIVGKEQLNRAVIVDDHNRRWYASWQAPTPLVTGAKYQVLMRIRPISELSNWHSFARQRWLVSQNISAQALVYQAQRINDSQGVRDRLLNYFIEQTKEYAHSDVMIALGFGERFLFKRDKWQDFQHSATAHLIAISGLHIGLVFFFGMMLGKALSLIALFSQSQPKWLVSVHFHHGIGVICAVCYAYLANFTPPTTRALFALMVLLALRYGRRSYLPLEQWSIIVGLLMITEPLNALSVSFYLSVLAVLALILWYHFFPLKSFVLKLNIAHYFQPQLSGQAVKIMAKFAQWMLALVHLQLGMSLLFTPILILVFNGFSPLAMLTNLILVPLYSLAIIPLVLISLVSFDYFHTFALADRLIDLSLKVLAVIGNHWIDLPLIYQHLAIGINLMIIAVLGAVLYSKGIAIKAMFGVMVIFLGDMWVNFYAKERYRFVVFDAGQALATMLIYHQGLSKQAIIYDTGNAFPSHSFARQAIIPFIRREAIKLRAIIISHNDSDHAGGVNDLIDAFAPLALYAPSVQKYREIRPLACIAGRTLALGKAQFTALAPYRQLERAKNEDSCVLVVNILGTRMLLTGDIGINEEKMLINNLPPIDIVQIPHHGSKRSSSDQFLTALGAHHAFVSAGRFNPWRHPRDEVLDRYAQHGILVSNTIASGMIIFDFYDQHYRITTARSIFSPWYQQKF